jgi:NAD(P)-dependent dehydrogenase (short-subunit alcohol dehydrogenase family)
VIGTAFCERAAETYDIVAVRHRRPLRVTSQLRQYFDPFAASAGAAVTTAGVFEVTADLCDPREVERVVEVALARFGQIDVVVNAIGSSDAGSQLLGNALDRVSDLFARNVLAPLSVAVQLTQELWRHRDLENAQRNRVVINLSATASVDPDDRARGTGFGATKAALNLLTLHLADELRPFNVRVLTIAPGPVPDVVSVDRVTDAIVSMIEGDESGRMLLMWDDSDELS